MSDFIQPIPTPTPPPAPTAASITAGLQDVSSRIFDAMVRQTKGSFDAIWNNRKFTPVQMWAALGDKAAKALQAHIAAVTFIETVKPGTLEDKYKTAPQQVTVNPDGTVTL
jgi:hypothetical protein